MDMRIITPRGVVREFNKVIPFTEAVVQINGRKRNIFESAKKLEYATGVVLADDRNVFAENDFVVGNLKNDKVEEIIHSLAEKGYYDFTGVEYQDAKKVADAVIGNDTKPYCSEFTHFDFMSLGDIKGNFNLSGASPFGYRELPFPDDEDDLTDVGGGEDCD